MIKKTLLTAFLVCCTLIIGIASVSAAPLAPINQLQTVQADETEKCDGGKEEETAKCGDGKDKEGSKCGADKCGAGKCE